ncbi:hypothetical protein GCM10010277_86900 [Streptomyces longisporoflavus]|nr:hypothetical protein GCM10010277_86900 [Streptomyces longisporoflavus]
MAQGTRVSRARRWWRSTPRLIRRFSVVLLVIGAALAGTGLWLDRTGWWEDHGFLGNLVSSFTSLCFGVPTALLVLSHLGNAQADARQTHRAEDQARRGVHEFQAALTRIFDVTDIADLVTRAQSMRRSVRRLRQLDDTDASAVTHFFRSFNDLLELGPTPSPAYTEPASFRDLACDRWQWKRIETWHVRVETQWRVLSEETRPKVHEFRLPWLAPSPAALGQLAARRLLAEGGRNPWRLPEGCTDADAGEAMEHFLYDLQVLSRTAQTLSNLYPTVPTSTSPSA